MTRTRSFFRAHPTVVLGGLVLAVALGLALFSTLAGAITTDAYITTVAGTGTAGNAVSSATTSSATFRNPWGVAIDSAGDFYVADSGNNCIRKISSSGTVTLIAGSGTTASGYVNATGTAARFKNPRGVAVDSDGNIYVADYGNNCVRKVTPAGVVSTYAGSTATKKNWGSANGVGTAARFRGPSGLVIDAAGNLFVADTANNQIRKIAPGAVVSTYAGSTTGGSTNGVGTAATFRSPQGVAIGTSGALFVADTGNNKIRRIDSARAVTTYAGTGVAGRTNGAGTAATFSGPTGACLTADGALYISDTGNNELRRIGADKTVSLLAGDPAGTSGASDGISSAARFSGPRTIAATTKGTFVLADYGNHKLRGVEVDTFASISATAGANGAISPSGKQLVLLGSDSATYTIAPAIGYHVANVLVDGKSVGAVSEYKFPKVTADHTISATFAINTYRITPTAGANGAISPTTAQTVNYGGSATFSVVPAAHYHIADVLVDGESIGASSSVTFDSVTANHSLAASFAIDTYPITATAGEHGAITPGTQDVGWNQNATFSVVPDPHYHIVDVLVDGTSVGASSTVMFRNVTSAHTISATFAIDTFTIKPSAAIHGWITPDTTQTVEYGGSATFEITAAYGYHIADVLVDGASIGASSSVTFDNVDANHTVRGLFAINTFTIEPTAGPHGSITPGTNQTVDWSSEITFEVAAHDQYHILNVVVDGRSIGASSSVTFENVRADHTLSASFEINPDAAFTLLPVAAAHGSITPETAQIVAPGDSATFDIVADAHYHIADVLVDGESIGASSSVTFDNVDENHTIEPKFAIDTFTIEPTAGAHGSISPGVTQVVDYGGHRTFLVVPDRHYLIEDVLVDGASVGASSSVTFSAVDTNHTISATFAFDPNTRFDIVPFAGVHGSIAPTSTQSVAWHGSARFTIKPVAGCLIDDVIVDGASIGASSSVTFSDVSADHTITATFKVPVARVAASNRYSTAVAAALRAFPKWTGVRHLVIASGNVNQTEAMVAAGLAGVYKCPVLIVPAKSLDTSVRSAILAMPRGLQVHIVGNTSSVSSAVATKIKGLSKVRSVERIAGNDRYGTAAAVARRMKSLLGTKMPRTVFIVNGGSGSDALFASTVAYRMHYPILFTQPWRIPASTLNTLRDLRLSNRYIVGSSTLVSDGVRKYLSIPTTKRITGPTAAGTSAAFANRGLTMRWLGRGSVGCASSVAEVPTAGAFMGRRGAPVLVVGASSVPSETQTWITTNKAVVSAGFLFGRTALVSEAVRTKLEALLK